jgi:hypothetical protein
MLTEYLRKRILRNKRDDVVVVRDWLGCLSECVYG